jgi:Leucine-rich repeat (LRR) protein
MKECFIIEDGVERKAELEDILPLICETGIQHIFRDAIRANIELPNAIAHMADDIKDKIYRNLPSRIRQTIEKEVKATESWNEKFSWNNIYEREKLISFIGENENAWLPDNTERIVWKEIKPKEPTNPIEDLINIIEKACVSGRLRLYKYDTDKMSEKDIQNAFMAFQDRKDELHKIHHLDIDAEDLHAVGLLFEAGGIDSLDINGEFDGPWPEFLKDYRALTSISFNICEGLTKLPSWIHNIFSLRQLSISRSNITLLPDWIGDMQSLTDIEICYNNENLKTLPDSICNLKNLAKLSIRGTVLEKLPDNIGNLTSLKELYLNNNKNLASLPDSIGNLKNLVCLSIYETALEKLPDSIGNLFSLKELSLLGNNNLTSLPDSTGNLRNLVKFDVSHSYLEKLPDSIGDLSSLKELSLYCNFKLTSLPDSIGNLKNLTGFYLKFSFIKALPDWIGNLQNLSKLSLEGTKIKSLPDSIGRLKNLSALNLCDTGIEKLPETIVNCSSLDYVDIRRTNINSFPDFISSIKTLKQSIEVIPIKEVYSYRSFRDCYYTLVANLIQFAIKAGAEGILSLEEELEYIPDAFFKEGLRLLVNGTDDNIIRQILTLRIDRESDHYRKKLMETVMEGILCIQHNYSVPRIGIRLASMVEIKNNPLNAAFTQYLAGDCEAFEKFYFRAVLQPEEECEEMLFIKRAIESHKIYCKEGLLALEKHLDNDCIVAKDVFEYGLFLLVECWNYKDIDNVLTMFIACETNPVRKNLAMAKKEAVRMIYEGDISGSFIPTLLAYFDDDVAKDFLAE